MGENAPRGQGSSALVGDRGLPPPRPPRQGPRPPAFLGLAFASSSIPGWVGPDLADPNPVLVGLIHNLDPTGRPVIRIGGLSTDHSWWPVPGMAPPKGVTYSLG